MKAHNLAVLAALSLAALLPVGRAGGAAPRRHAGPTAKLKAEIKTLQSTLAEKNKHIEGLEDHVAKLNQQIAELRAECLRHGLKVRPRLYPGKGSQADYLGKLGQRKYKGTKYYYYIPRTARRNPSEALGVLALIHGRSLNPDEYANRWLKVAEQRRIVVIAPLFDDETFHGYNRLNIEKPRADIRLLEIIEDAAALWPLRTERIFMYGHSAGAQFAHRFAMVHPDRIVKGVASCAGNYTFPDTAVRYPYGTGHRPQTKDMKLDLDAFVQMDFAIIVGRLDTDPNNMGAANCNQGANRLARARNFYLAMKTYAQDRKLPFKLKFAIISNAGHSSKRTTPWAKKYLFGVK